MADSAVPITAGSGTNIDTRTETTNSNHRQVVVLGDPATNAGVAPVDATTGLTVNDVPATTGGYDMATVVSAGSTNATNLKPSAGQVFAVTISNRTSTTTYPVYVKFHNTAGTPTAGSGVVWVCGANAGADVSYTYKHGLKFSTGIAYTIVKDIAASGTTAVLASDCVVSIAYK